MEFGHLDAARLLVCMGAKVHISTGEPSFQEMKRHRILFHSILSSAQVFAPCCHPSCLAQQLLLLLLVVLFLTFALSSRTARHTRRRGRKNKKKTLFIRALQNIHTTPNGSYFSLAQHRNGIYTTRKRNER